MNVAQLVIGGDVAGGQIVALQVARAARARGDRVMFLSPARGPFTELVEQEGMRVELVDVSRTFRLGGAVRLARLLHRERVDVLHTHTALAANVLSRVAGRLAGAAVVTHIHIENYMRPNRVARAIHTVLDNTSARLAARVLAVSASTRDALVRQGYPRDRIDVIYNGIDLGRRAGEGGALRQELGLAASVPIVGEVARLCDVKGQRELVEAAASLPGVHVVLIGTDIEQGGAYRDRLVALARELGVDERVHLLGYRRDVDRLLDDLDVVALPSSIEGLPLIVLEAMAHARPVVATAVGGTPELVADGATGILIAPNDATALADALRELLDDRERARTMGAAGRERVEREFSEAAMTTRVLAVYDAVA